MKSDTPRMMKARLREKKLRQGVKPWDRGDARHFLMRVGLALVLGWFGAQELRNPSDWVVFVPSFISGHSPIAADHLVFLHGFLLLFAALSIATGLRYLLGCLLAIGLLSEIVVSLWLDSGVSGLIIRDLGLLTLASALALDPAHSHQIEGLLSRLSRLPGVARPLGQRTEAALPKQRSRLVQAGGTLVLAAAVLGVAFLLQPTSRSSEALLQGPVATSPPVAAPPSPAASASAPEAQTATPVPTSTAATAIRFDSWRDRRYAFQIYPGDISPEAKRALAGFAFSVQDQGDQVLLVFKALSPYYHDAQIPMDKTNTAYFVETSMRDDPNNGENDLGDDGVVAVDPQGYIVQS